MNDEPTRGAVSGEGPVVGLVGIGRMGGAMARSLARAGRPLILANRSPGAAGSLADELGSAGASVRVAATPADVAAQAQIVITMLADDAAVESVWAGPHGLLETAHADQVLVDCSTITPATIRGLETAVRARGAGLLDSPVSGSTALAESGGLTLMVGGTAGDLERARPALEPLAKRIFHLGPVGAGAAMKLAVNTVIFGLNEALAEALLLAERAGIAIADAHEVIASSAAGAPFVGYKRGAYVEPEATPVAFAVDLALKDLRLIGAMAAGSGVELPGADASRAVLQAASDAGLGAADFSAVIRQLRATRPAGEGAPS
jgi:3-hydroxyisobutyrate dehydrogenase-like beta-hydroxyacid dehydrogenase